MKKIKKGMVTAQISGVDIAEFINKCTKEGIFLTKSIPEQDSFIVSVRSHEAKKLMRVVRGNKGRIKILKKEGWIFSWLKIRRKQGLFWGLVLIAGLLYLALGHIWSYDISGNVRYSNDEVIALVQKYGLNQGVSKKNLRLEDTAQEILKDYNGDIAWIWLGTHGTVLEVRIKEMDRTNTDYDKAADIIAADDAVVTDILPLSGEAVVKAGDAVSKGDILIKGVEYDNWQKNAEGIYVPADEGRAVRAEGEVHGLVLDENYVATCLREHYFLAQDQIEICYSLWKNGREIWNNGENTPALEKLLWQKAWQLGQDSWSVQKSECMKQNLAKKEYTPEEAYEISIKRAQKYQEKIGARDIFKLEWELVSSSRENIVYINEKVWHKEDLASLKYRDVN